MKHKGYLWPCDGWDWVSRCDAGQDRIGANCHFLCLRLCSNLRQGYKVHRFQESWFSYRCIVWHLFLRSHIIQLNIYNVLTLDIKDHMWMLGANIISGCAAVLSWIWFGHLINPQDVPLYFHVIRKGASHFTPAHCGLGVTDRIALKLHWVAHHHRLYWRADVDFHFG